MSNTVTIKVFADECSIYKEVLCEEDHRVLQDSVLSVERWCREWDMEINVDETVLLRITCEKTA